MYLDYFALERHPFRITPDPSLFFPGGTHGRGVVLDALVYGITSGEGILKVVGEVGSGKTMLCRMLEERLPKNIEIVYIANPSLGAREIVYAIAIELGLDVDANTDRLQVMHKLQEYLLRKHVEGGSVVVFIEEAQSMPLETLEEVRLLSNLETHRHKLMQIVLFGQPELDRKLEQKSIRQLRERITHSFNLEPLSAGETRAYLHFRLQSAGCPWPQLFHPKAELMLAKAAGGLTRRINILADKALLASYADPATRPEPRSSSGEIQPMVLPRHVKVAIADSAYKSMSSYTGGERRLPAWLGYPAAALAGALMLWAVLGWQFRSDRSAVPELPVASGQAASGQEQPASAQPGPAVRTPEQASRVSMVNERGSTIPEPDDLPAEVGSAGGAAGVVVVAENLEDASLAVLAAAPVPFAEEEPVYRPVTRTEPVLEGLIGARQAASREWLASLAGKRGYTVQLYSAAAGDVALLEDFLDFLSLSGLLEQTWLCRLSANSQRPGQWLVLHGEFSALSDSRRFIEGLPTFVSQHGPYVRNLDGVACANVSP